MSAIDGAGRDRKGAHIALVLVAAIADNDVIGSEGGLPWRLKSDMHHFRALTSGKPVVMGHKTYQSIGRPLPNRTNIVVSRDPAVSIREVIVTTSLEAALTVARGDALRRQADAIMVIGGADLYAQTLVWADRLEITRVHIKARGEVTFPPIRPATWREIARNEFTAGPGDEANFTLLTYERIGR